MMLTNKYVQINIWKVEKLASEIKLRELPVFAIRKAMLLLKRWLLVNED